MTAKPAVAVILGVLCFAPVALVARHEQIRLRAFTTEAAAAKIGRGVVADVEAAQPRSLELATVEVFAKRTPPPPAAPVASATCQRWRELAGGARVRSATTAWVRACDGPPDADLAAPAAAPAKAPRPGAADRSLQWIVDLAAPR